ncbi:MAG: S9 family peptidase [Candidatus Promineofilum sp.]|nr:S9 family peptidase [Promineifilum sp.]
MTTPLIPRRLFFGNPDRAQVTISPDGAHIAWLAPRDGVLNVWVAPRERPADARPVTADTGRGIRFYTWAYTGRDVLYIQDKGGDENWRVYAADVATGEVGDLTPFEGVAAQLVAASHRRPEEIVVALNNRDPQWHDIYRINVTTGDRELLLEHDRFAGVDVDEDLMVRSAAEMTPDGGMTLYRAEGEGWGEWEKIPPGDVLTTSPAGFDKTGNVLYMRDSRGRDTAALYAIDLTTSERTLLAEDPRADAADALIHPTERTVQAVAFVYDRKRWQVLDPSIEPDLAYLRSVADGDVEITSRSLDDRTWLVAFQVDDGPVRYYLYDRERGAADFLFTNRSELEGLPLAKMHPAVISARDGLSLVAYYSLPPGADSDGDGIPNAPLPTVFMPHGGPWARDNWGFNGWHQWLANRGYAVLSVNFRSSTGFGKAFTNAGDMEWAGKILEDQQDAVQWAIAQGIADPARVAVMGGSFGGYSTLAGLTFYPEVFACGVDIVGPSNLITLLESVPPYWKPMIELFYTRVGDLRTDEGRALLTAHSPLTHVSRIARPLLIAQGANDPRVKQAESDQIVSAMQAKGIPVAYALYPDEGHGFARPENNLSFAALAEAFLGRCLGGRVQPIGDDLSGSSLTVPVGAAEVPGLVEALEK